MGTPTTDRSLVLGGATIVGRGTPWGTMVEFARDFLTPLGYDVHIETRCWGLDNPRFVADGRTDIGATVISFLTSAYAGTGPYADEPARGNLRMIANLNQPMWLTAASTVESGITDLAQIMDERRPVRIRSSVGAVNHLLFDHFGWTPQALVGFGASLRAPEDYPGYVEHNDAPVVEPRRTPWIVAGDFDVLSGTLMGGSYTPENRYWIEASILADLPMLPLPAQLIDTLVANGWGTASVVPRRTIRGAWTEVDALLWHPVAYYCRADTRDETVAALARALDVNRAVFRNSHLAFSYDPETVCEDLGVPFHHAALRYYAERGYPRG